jgi:hypothetical protein
MYICVLIEKSYYISTHTHYLTFFWYAPFGCLYFIYNEPELGAGIDPGMALTPLPSSIGRGSNPRPSDREPSALLLDNSFHTLCDFLMCNSFSPTPPPQLFEQHFCESVLGHLSLPPVRRRIVNIKGVKIMKLIQKIFKHTREKGCLGNEIYFDSTLFIVIFQFLLFA